MQKQNHEACLQKEDSQELSACVEKADLLQQKGLQNVERCIAMGGFPYDQGTLRNGGRVGGAVASKVFREMLLQHRVYLKKTVKILDFGDIDPQISTLEEAHQELLVKNKQILSKIGKESLFFMIGGSNDQSYCNVKALLQTYKDSKIGVINLDSHFDVRPLKDNKAHSGSPFRLMLQQETFIKNKSVFVQFGCKGSTCSSQHLSYLKSKNVKVYWMEKDIRLHERDEQEDCKKTQAGDLFHKIINKMIEIDKVEAIFVSFDTDSISSLYMPGVSAPSVCGGLTNLEALQICQISGKTRQVKMIDFSQFNPAVEANLSSRLLVEMFGRICETFRER